MVVGAVAMGLLLLRRPTSLTRPEFADEDGQVFYLGAVLHGPASVFEPYAGYLHVAARLLALPEALVPPEHAPLVGSLGSLLVVAGVAVYMLRLEVPRQVALAVAAAVILLADSRQTLGFVNSIQWYLAMLLVAGVFVKPRWFDYPLLGIVSLTGPFSAMVLPIYVWLARDLRAVVVAGGAAVQALVIYLSPRVQAKGDVDLGVILVGLAERGALGRILGEHQLRIGLPLELVLLFGAAVAALVVIAVGRLSRPALVVAYASIGIAVFGMLFAAYRGWYVVTGAGSRYFLGIGLALALAAIAGLSSTSRSRRLAGGLLAALLIVGMVRDFHVPEWPYQGWAALAPACIGSPQPCEVPVFPSPNWDVRWPGDSGTYFAGAREYLPD